MSRKYFRDELRKILALNALLPVCLLLAIFFLLVGIFWYSSVISGNEEARMRLASEVTSMVRDCSTALSEAGRSCSPEEARRNPEVLRRLSERLYSTAVKYPRPGRPAFYLLDKGLRVIASSSTERPDILSTDGPLWGISARIIMSRGKAVFDFTADGLAVGEAVMEKGEPAGYLLYIIPKAAFEKYMFQPNVSLALTDSFDYVRLSDSGRFRDEQGRLRQGAEKEGYIFFNGGIFYVTSSEILDGALTVRAFTPVSPILRSFGALALVLLLSLAVVTLGILRATSRIAEKKTRIIDDLVAAFENVMQGHLSTKLAISSGDEFEVIGDAYNVMLDSLRDLIRKNGEEARRTALSEIKQLESQFNPHFLFNTLENIRVMTAINPQDARKMILELSALLRYSIGGGGMSTELAEDIEITERYLRIQKYRFGTRFSYEIRTEPGTEKAIVPRLMLQPLIENSIVHSFRTKERLSLSIKAEQSEGKLRITVTDDGDGIAPEKLLALQKMIKEEKNETQRIGLFNIARRIRLMYGEDYGMTIESQEGTGTVVSLTLPSKGPEEETNAEASDS